MQNPTKKKKIDNINNQKNILKNNNNENENYNLETKKGILPNMMLLRQICDFPDLNYENENFDIEDRKDENRKIDIINYNANDVNEYGCATVKRHNNNDDNHNDDNNDNNNESNKDTNNFNINYQAERLQKENENFVSILTKNSNKLKVTLFNLFYLLYFNSFFYFLFFYFY